MFWGGVQHTMSLFTTTSVFIAEVVLFSSKIYFVQNFNFNIMCIHYVRTT